MSHMQKGFYELQDHNGILYHARVQRCMVTVVTKTGDGAEDRVIFGALDRDFTQHRQHGDIRDDDASDSSNSSGDIDWGSDGDTNNTPADNTPINVTIHSIELDHPWAFSSHACRALLQAGMAFVAQCYREARCTFTYADSMMIPYPQQRHMPWVELASYWLVTTGKHWFEDVMGARSRYPRNAMYTTGMQALKAALASPATAPDLSTIWGHRLSRWVMKIVPNVHGSTWEMDPPEPPESVLTRVTKLENGRPADWRNVSAASQRMDPGCIWWECMRARRKAWIRERAAPPLQTTSCGVNPACRACAASGL